MRNDKNIRDYYLIPKVSNTPLGSEPTSFSEFLDKMKEKQDYDMTQFEVEDPNEMLIAQNMLDKYFPYLDRPEYKFTMKFDKYLASHMEFKSRSISKYFYGDTRLFWVLFKLNDITHDSDLTKDYLMNSGLTVFNLEGLQAFKKLLTFKERVETMDGQGVFFDPEI